MSKNPHAVALGRRGGKASRRLAKLPEEERRKVAAAGGRALWADHRPGSPACECRGCARGKGATRPTR